MSRRSEAQRELANLERRRAEVGILLTKTRSDLEPLLVEIASTDDPEASIPGGNSINGIGFINGVRSMICVDDSGINAGATHPGISPPFDLTPLLPRFFYSSNARKIGA